MTAGKLQPLGKDDLRQAGPCRLEARLGRGGTGAVFLGRTRAGRAVAMKVIGPQLAEDEGFRRRLANELDALGRVTGTGLLETVAADPTADRPNSPLNLGFTCPPHHACSCTSVCTVSTRWEYGG